MGNKKDIAGPVKVAEYLKYAQEERLRRKINKFYNYFDMIKNLNYNKVRTREEIVMDSLTGKVALVTGASRGIGSAIAKN